MARPLQDVCKRGHPLAEPNLYWCAGKRRCKTCQREKLNAWYRAHREAVNERSLRYYYEHREERNRKSLEYYYANHEETKAKGLARYYANRDEINRKRRKDGAA